jgi:hypothetical protein
MLQSAHVCVKLDINVSLSINTTIYFYFIFYILDGALKVILAKPRASARFPRTVDAKKVLGIGGDPLPMLVESTSMRRDVLPYFFHVPKV